MSGGERPPESRPALHPPPCAEDSIDTEVECPRCASCQICHGTGRTTPEKRVMWHALHGGGGR
jgi:hypothetical protein